MAARHTAEPVVAIGSLGSLADPHVGHGTVAVDHRSRAQLVEWLGRMLLIRRAEEHVAALVSSHEAKCPCHLAVGQEACAVGVASVLTPADRIFGAHRSHGHYLALGGDINAMFAEILGKATGCSGGMGGSMHLVDPAHGLLGTVPIVGATIPMAVGAALAASLEGSDAVGVAFFGDGASEEGVFHESLNLAAVHKLPVLFVCENNLFASHLHIGLRQPDDCVARFAQAHRVACEIVDGNDVATVADAAGRLVSRARAAGGPGFLELVTYRWRGHVGPSEDIDVGVKRGEELQFWKQRDPIRRLGEGMVAAGLVTAAEIEAMDLEAIARADAAVAFARESAYPSKDAADRYLYASSAHVR